MLTVEEIFDKIKKIMGIKTDKDLAEFFEISSSHLANYKTRKNIPFEKIIEKSPGNYNLEYVFFGKGRAQPPSFELNEDIDYEFMGLVSKYAPPKMREEMREKLLKIKELGES